MADKTPEEIYNELNAFRRLVMERLSAMDSTLQAMSLRVDKASNNENVNRAITAVESLVSALRQEVVVLNRQMELYLSSEQLKSHNHDGIFTQKVSYSNLDNTPSGGVLASKADASRGVDLSGYGNTGEPIAFPAAYSDKPFIVPVLLNSEGVVNTQLKVSALGFTFKAFSESTELKGLPFSYLVWKPSV